jgi:acyl-homoserine lactone acylase PvdQ
VARHLGKTTALVAATAVLVTTLAAGPGSATTAPVDRARYILPPGNFGGLPTTTNSRDQLPLYDGLTPLRGNVSDADINNLYLPENFAPVGPTHEELTGRAGTTILYDSYGIPHIHGDTKEDLAFGAGWATARDRGLLIQLGRGPARVAVADVPGIDAFSLVVSGQQFIPSAATEKLVSDQQKLLVDTYGAKGQEIIDEAQAEADGINAYWAANHISQPPATVDDVIAVTAFIGSIFGAGGGGEARNAELLDELQHQLGATKGAQAWNDVTLPNDPEAPTTTRKRFNYPALTGGAVKGSVTIDAGSIISIDPRVPGSQAGPSATAKPATVNAADAAPLTAAAPSGNMIGTQPNPDGTYDAASAPPDRQASNFLVVNPSRSATGDSLAVMGPQLGYYYPEIVEQMDLSGPGVQAQGAVVPGLAMYVLIGRTQNYAWSLTSADHDVRDVFAEQLCNPDHSAPTRASDHYLYKGVCTPMQTFDAGSLNGTELTYPTTVHGPIIGTATVGGQPYALSRERSTFGRDGLNLAALKDMTDGAATTPQNFFDTANEFGFTFNWAYVSRDTTAYFSSGLLPARARHLDRRLPTLGTGQYDWQGFLTENQHPHDIAGTGGLLRNWNNQSAPGFMHGDDNPYGSIHRVELFSPFPSKVHLNEDVGIMNRAATEDVRAPVWPAISHVLHTAPAPTPFDAQVLTLLDDWVAQAAPRLDADNSGQYDDAGPTVMDAIWGPVAAAVMSPVFGPVLSELDAVEGLGGLSGESYVDKDLRTLLVPNTVKGKFNLRYCGLGDLATCRSSLWSAIDSALTPIVVAQGSNPNAWRSTAARTGFVPGLISDTMRATNRPTFQQVIEFGHAS